MIGWGIMLLIVGIGSFILPSMGIQFSLIQIFGQGNEWMAGTIFAIIGALLLVFGLLSNKNVVNE